VTDDHVTDDHEMDGPFPAAPEPPAPPTPPRSASDDPAFGTLGAEPLPGDVEPQDAESHSAAPAAALADERDSMERPPTERYPDGRTSPPEPVAAERWAFHPDAPPPRPPLRRRLWWVPPFGISLLTGLVFALACLAYQASGHPDFAGNACMIATIAAIVLAWLVATDLGISGLPTHPVAGTCAGLFAVAPAVTWILVGLT
jgi:hypothetical protein